MENKVLNWRHCWSPRSKWELFDGPHVVAFLGNSLSRPPFNDFHGNYKELDFELTYVSKKTDNFFSNYAQDEMAHYSIYIGKNWSKYIKERKEWGRLIHGIRPDLSPAYFIVHNLGTYFLLCSVDPEYRHCSVSYKQDEGYRTVGIMRRARRKIWDPGSFLLKDYRPDDPEPAIIAMIAFCYSTMVTNIYDGGI